VLAAAPSITVVFESVIPVGGLFDVVGEHPEYMSAATVRAQQIRKIFLIIQPPF
jgi:hypothetical protein